MKCVNSMHGCCKHTEVSSPCSYPTLHLVRSISKEKIKPPPPKKPFLKTWAIPSVWGKWSSKDLPCFTCGCLILYLSTEVSDAVFRPLEQSVNSACTSGKWSHMANLFSSPVWKRQRVLVTSVLGPVLPAAFKYTVLCVTWGDHKWKYCLEMLQPSFWVCAMDLGDSMYWVKFKHTCTQIIQSHFSNETAVHIDKAWPVHDISLTNWGLTGNMKLNLQIFCDFQKAFTSQCAVLCGVFCLFEVDFLLWYKNTPASFPYLEHSHPVRQT